MSNEIDYNSYEILVETEGKTILTKTILNSSVAIEDILRGVVEYIEQEGINEIGECSISVKCLNPSDLEKNYGR